VNSNSSSTLANSLALALALRSDVSLGDASSVVPSRAFSL
jgi:hypothetical protein